MIDLSFLIFGMCKVALADRTASRAEIRLIIEIARAEARTQTINTAYDWLKEHPR
jgi:hypothetical protein